MGNGSNLALVLFVAAAFGAGGWYARGVYDGSVVDAREAAQDSQQAVDTGAASVAAITTARTETEQAVERVRTVTRTVTVAGECPPGAGAVSDDFALQLRALAQSRAITTDTSARGVP